MATTHPTSVESASARLAQEIQVPVEHSCPSPRPATSSSCSHASDRAGQSLRRLTIPGYSGFELQEDGKVFSKKTGNVLQVSKSNGCVTLIADGGRRTARSAKSLLAEIFPRDEEDVPPQMRPIPGYDGYFVSPDGRIFSSRRYGRAGMIFEMRQHRNNGYLCVTINSGGIHCVLRAHIAVALAYVGPKPSDDAVVRHLDGTRDNNFYTNLKWGTTQENAEDMVRHGRAGRARGERSWSAKLTEDGVREIRRLAAEGKTQTEISGITGISRPQIGHIIRRRSWKHVL